MKKILFLFIFLYFAAAAVAAHGSGLHYDYVFEPFDTCAAGEIPESWRTTGTGSVGVREIPAAADKSVELIGVSGSQPARLYRDGDAITSSALVSVDFMQPVKSNISQLLYLGAENSSTDNMVMNIASNGTELIVTHKNGSDVVGAYEAHVWYNIKVFADVETKVLEVYLDGRRVLSHKTLYFAGNTTPNIRRVSFRMDHPQKLYIDNIGVALEQQYRPEEGISDTFDHDAVGTVPVGWAPAGSGAAAVTDTLSPRRHAVRLLPSDDGSPVRLIKQAGVDISGNTVAQIDFMQPVRGSAAQLLYLGAEPFGAENTIVEIAADGNTITAAHRGGAAVVAPYEAGKWYTVTVYLDMNNGIFKVFVNHQQMLSDRVLYFPGTDTQKIQRISFGAGNGKALYLDNLSLKRQSAAITIRDPNRTGSQGYFAKRGIPFAKGEVTDISALFLKRRGGGIVPAQFEVLQRYDDGSVHWASAAVYMPLAAGETVELDICYADDTVHHQTDIEVIESGASVTLKNSRIALTCGENGITGMGYQGVELLKSGGVNLIVEDGAGNTFAMTDCAVETVFHGPVYATVRLSGVFAGLGVKGELYVTLYAYSGDLDYELRYTAAPNAAKVVLKTTGLRLSLKAGFTQNRWDPESVPGSQYPNLKAGAWYSAYNAPDDISVSLITRDNKKFLGAVSQTGGSTGGFIGDGNGEILFAPLQYQADWTFYDGVSRTFHLKMKVQSAQAGDADLAREKTAVFHPPIAAVAPERFVFGGVIPQSRLTAPAQRIAAAVRFTRDRRWGRFEAGSIPYCADSEANTVSVFEMRPGDVEYNIWHAQMAAGDHVLYDILTDSAESWADVVQYRGGIQEIYGVNRYRTGSEYGQDKYFGGQLYYGDASGLYMTYLMTGQPYFKEAFRAGEDYVVANLQKHGILVHLSWINGRLAYRDDGCEVRVSTHVRPLYMAYRLFEDEKYLDAALEVARYVADRQEEGGYWYQRYNRDHTPADTSGIKPMVKNYIMLYYMRSYCYLYENAKEPWMGDTITRFSDYLYDELQEGGWMFDPTADIALTETNEDDTRGTSHMQEIMAADVFRAAYEATQNVKYLEGMLKTLRYWLAAQLPGGLTPQRYNLQGYAGGKITYRGQLGQNTALLSAGPQITALMDRSKELIEALGYGDVASVMSENTVFEGRALTNPFSTPEFSLNHYYTPEGHVLYMTNQSGLNSGLWTKSLHMQLSGDGSLWQGIENVVSGGKTYAAKQMAQFDLLFARKTPVRITGCDARIQVTAYNSEGLSMLVTGGEGMMAEIADGIFAVRDSRQYLLAYDGRQFPLYAADGTLQFMLDLGEGAHMVTLTAGHAPGAIKAGAPVYKKRIGENDFQAVDRLSNGSIRIETAAENNGGAPAPVTLIFAVYDKQDSRLVEIAAKTRELMPGEVALIYQDIVIDNIENKRYKVFVWSSFPAMEPVASG